VSIIAVNYAVYIQGTINYLYGTSASTPVFAGMISLINAEREKEGLGTVGFINPTLYSVNNTEKYNDITIGSNNCCSSSDSKSAYCCRGGFEARKGWDPVTGHGSVMYDNLLSMFMQ
jgi:tripeptidyl-peptidase I